MKPGSNSPVFILLLFPNGRVSFLSLPLPLPLPLSFPFPLSLSVVTVGRAASLGVGRFGPLWRGGEGRRGAVKPVPGVVVGAAEAGQPPGSLLRAKHTVGAWRRGERMGGGEGGSYCKLTGPGTLSWTYKPKTFHQQKLLLPLSLAALSLKVCLQGPVRG